MKLLAVLSLSLISTLAAQTGAADKAASLKESIAKNQAALKQYAWGETTEISLKGEVKKTEQKQCHYGPDGKVQKTEIPGAQPQQAPQQAAGRGRRRGGGLVKKEIIEHKVEELKEYMQKTAALLHEYAPPDHAKIQAAQQAGHVTIKPGDGGVASFVITDYAKPGDQLSLEFDTAAKKLKSYNVSSYLDDKKDDAVMLSVNFASLPNGVNHVADTLLDVKAKHIQVRTTNANYQKAAQ